MSDRGSRYCKEDIERAYRDLGIGAGDVVLVKSDLRWLGRSVYDDKQDLLRAHFDALADVVDLERGTIVVPTSSTFLCNTDVPYSASETRSERGALTEYLRKLPSAVRSRHPFMSYAAVGARAHEICDNVARMSFGPESVKARLIDRGAVCVSLGALPNMTATVVHHAEFVAGVPYRYVKEFMHPVVRDGRTVVEPFYLHVWYRECEIKRNKNKKLFKHFEERGGEVRSTKLGAGAAHAYDLREFFQSCVTSLLDDIYVWTESPPDVRPYRK